MHRERERERYVYIFNEFQCSGLYFIFRTIKSRGGFSDDDDDDDDDYTVLALRTSQPFFDQAPKKQKTENRFPSNYVFAENILNRR